jgi:hypothetical protein
MAMQVRAVIPRRNDLPGDRGVLIVAHASHRKKAYSFFLLQVRRQRGTAPPPQAQLGHLAFRSQFKRDTQRCC